MYIIRIWGGHDQWLTLWNALPPFQPMINLVMWTLHKITSLLYLYVFVCLFIFVYTTLEPKKSFRQRHLTSPNKSKACLRVKTAGNCILTIKVPTRQGHLCVSVCAYVRIFVRSDWFFREEQENVSAETVSRECTCKHTQAIEWAVGILSALKVLPLSQKVKGYSSYHILRLSVFTYISMLACVCLCSCVHIRVCVCVPIWENTDQPGGLLRLCVLALSGRLLRWRRRSGGLGKRPRRIRLNFVCRPDEEHLFIRRL